MSAWIAAGALALAVALAGRPPPGRRVEALGNAQVGAAGTGLQAGWIVGALVAVVALRWSAVPVLAGAGASAAVLDRVRRSRKAAKDRERRASAVVELTFALAGELRAGRTPAQALAAAAVVAGPLRAAIEAASAAVHVGGSAGDELRRAAAQPGAERLSYVAAAWTVTETVGGRIAVVLERLSEAMDDDDELRRELASAMAGPHATMAMLAVLPLLGLGLGQAVGAHPLDLLLHRPVGWALLALAAALDGIGVYATRAIARTALRP